MNIICGFIHLVLASKMAGIMFEILTATEMKNAEAGMIAIGPKRL